MNKLGLIVNLKRLFFYWIFLIVGMSLIFIGVMGYYENQRRTASYLSDAEIIERAKTLGMVEIKERLNQQNTTSDETDKQDQ